MTAGLLLGEDATADQNVEEEDLQSGGIMAEWDDMSAPRWHGASLLQGPATSLSRPPDCLWPR
jgi:hypothetical protein